MKPYSYNGGHYNNLDDVFKWANGGNRRRKTRRASSSARCARRLTTRRAREAGKKACALHES